MATLTSIISAISKSIFKILVAIMKQISRAVEKRSEVPLYVLQNLRKLQKTKLNQYCGTPGIYIIYPECCQHFPSNFP